MIFASDNGGTKSSRNAPLRGYKGSTLEGGIRVPAIARWPGVIPAGVTSHQVCVTFDLTASIAAAARVRASDKEPLEGIDIVGHVAKGTADFERTIYWRKPRGETIWKGVREGTLKYVAKTEGDTTEDHLFDLADDIAEEHDLKETRPVDFQRLESLFQRWEQRTRRNRRGRPGD